MRAERDAILKRAKAEFAKSVRQMVEILGEQNKVSEMTGIAQSAVSDVVNGKRLPRADSIIAVARFLHRSVDSILGEVSHNNPSADAMLALTDESFRRRLYERLKLEFDHPSETQAEVAAASKIQEPKIPALPAPGGSFARTSPKRAKRRKPPKDSTAPE